MEKILNILDEWLREAVANGALEFNQVLLFLFCAGTLALVIWKAREIISFFQDVRDSRLNELQRVLDNHVLPDEVFLSLNDEIKRIIGYRNTGISDVVRQRIVWQLLMSNRQLIQIDFFKKFRSFLIIENNQLVFKKGISYWFEIIIYGIYSFQFLALAFVFVFLSIYKGEQIQFLEHSLLYLFAVILFLFFFHFVQLIPRRKECDLLDEILKRQSS